TAEHAAAASVSGAAEAEAANAAESATPAPRAVSPVMIRFTVHSCPCRAAGVARDLVTFSRSVPDVDARPRSVRFLTHSPGWCRNVRAGRRASVLARGRRVTVSWQHGNVVSEMS